jgi:hypothetical protein
MRQGASDGTGEAEPATGNRWERVPSDRAHDLKRRQLKRARSRIVIGLAVCLALAAAGCGSSSSNTSAATGGTSAAPAGSPVTPTTQPGSGQGASTTSGPGQSHASGSSRSESAGGIRSILKYGSAAGGAEKAAVAATARSYFTALADRDYANICAALSVGNREQMQLYMKDQHRRGGCMKVLKKLSISPQFIASARKAARGAVNSVRIKGDTAFLLFRPRGGSASYFVMKREGSAWRAINLSPGQPLNPSVP